MHNALAGCSAYCLRILERCIQRHVWGARDFELIVSKYLFEVL
jgi:hypothetical protein